MKTAASIIIDLILRDHGATIQELVDATGWQRHSIRGFVSAVMRKEMAMYIPTYHGRYLVRGLRPMPPEEEPLSARAMRFTKMELCLIGDALEWAIQKHNRPEFRYGELFSGIRETKQRYRDLKKRFQKP